MKKLPIGIQSINKVLLNGDYIYIDKTLFIKRLLDEGAPHYFLSRPRRFGKSLFLNTLKEVLSGNKELFRECAIYESDYDWKHHPIIHLDFSQIPNKNPELLETGIKETLEDIAASNQVTITGSSNKTRFKRLIEKLSKKNLVVILIDEYDKPIIDQMHHHSIAQENREVLKSFLETLKGSDDYLKFSFITGVSQFSQVSLFSGLNNLKNITMNPKYAEVMGYTEKEIKTSFDDHIQAIIKKRSEQGRSTTEKQVLKELRSWYNGYRFTRSEAYVYNPFSTLNYMDEQETSPYWYRTGTPSFLISQVKKTPETITTLRGKSILDTTLSHASHIEKVGLAPLMFQTGYLTIRSYNPEEDSYQLDFPNKEVEKAFFDSLLKDFAEIDPLMVQRDAKELLADLRELNLSSFITKINIHFAKVSYHLFSHAQEGFYQAVFFTLLEASGIRTVAEMATNIGRIDLICEMEHATIIFELKLDKTADIALKQAEIKKYQERYALDGKEILVMGVNFSSKSRNIGEWKGKLFCPSGGLKKELYPG
ncbi:ATP-binding protein [Candidatus Neptunochlamydia vexilliferae]|nr:ATP-binding protein [Candidatus Neptunochlamydia vexilliferae]